MQRERIYRVLLDSEWQLEDLYEFPQAFAKNYAFIYCLDSELAPRDRERINRALAEYPWRGGFSYVNINTVLHHQIPVHDRPKIRSIQYASPSWLDLLLNVDVAIQVAKSVGILLSAAGSAALTYKGIYKTLASIKVEREKSKLQELKLTQEQTKVVTNYWGQTTVSLYFRVNTRQLALLGQHQSFLEANPWSAFFYRQIPDFFLSQSSFVLSRPLSEYSRSGLATGRQVWGHV